jgi:sec-independent protein translocase protein TatC
MLGWLREEAKKLTRLLVKTGIVFVVVFFGTIALPLSPSDFGTVLSFTSYGVVGSSLAVFVLRWAERFLLPHGETIIVLGPFDAFTAIMEVAAFLAALVAIPYLFHLLFGYMRPGLRAREQRALRRMTALGTGFFVLGVLFTLFVVLPYLYLFSFDLQPIAGATGTVSLLAFLSTTVTFSLSIGLAFEVPTVCYGLALAGVLHAKVMRTYWRHAAFGSFILAFIVSPGVGGGLFETIIALAIFSVYLVGYGLVKRVERSKGILAIQPFVPSA